MRRYLRLRVEISPGWEIAISIIQVGAIPLPASGLDFCYLLDVLHPRSGERPTSCVVPYWPSGDRTDASVPNWAETPAIYHSADTATKASIRFGPAHSIASESRSSKMLSLVHKKKP